MEQTNCPLNTNIKTKRRFPIGFIDQFLTNKKNDNFKTIDLKKQSTNNNQIKINSNIFTEKHRKCQTPIYCKQERKLNKKKYIDFSQFYSKNSSNNPRNRIFNSKAKDNIYKIQQSHKELKELKEKQKQTPKKNHSVRHIIKNYNKLYDTKCNIRLLKDSKLLNKTNTEIKNNKSKSSNQTSQIFSLKENHNKVLGRKKYFDMESLREMINKASIKCDKEHSVSNNFINNTDKNNNTTDLINKVLLTIENFNYNNSNHPILTQYDHSSNEKPKIEYIKNKYKPIFELYDKHILH